MLQKAIKEETLSRTQVFEWFAGFKRGEMSVESHPQSIYKNQMEMLLRDLRSQILTDIVIRNT